MELFCADMEQIVKKCHICAHICCCSCIYEEKKSNASGAAAFLLRLLSQRRSLHFRFGLVAQLHVVIHFSLCPLPSPTCGFI